jgi:MarR family 2-MHQ and catechol resistance regulon transcriptional repressor
MPDRSKTILLTLRRHNRAVQTRSYLDIKMYYINRPMPAANHNIGSNSDASATKVWLVLSKAAHAIEQNALNSVSALGLGLSDFAVLEVLLHKGPLPVNAIGKKVLLTSGSITTAIDRLESRDLVRRSQDTEDLRTRIVHLTKAGQRLIENAFRQHALDLEETVAVLSATERVELVRLLKKAGIWAAARLEADEHKGKHLRA